jgi:hypothetical protein
MSDHSPFAALRHRRSRPHAVPNKVREVWSVREPSEAPTVSLRGRRHQPRQSQSKHAKKLTHRLIPLHPNTFPKGTDLIVAMAIVCIGPVGRSAAQRNENLNLAAYAVAAGHDWPEARR